MKSRRVLSLGIVLTSFPVWSSIVLGDEGGFELPPSFGRVMWGHVARPSCLSSVASPRWSTLTNRFPSLSADRIRHHVIELMTFPLSYLASMGQPCREACSHDRTDHDNYMDHNGCRSARLCHRPPTFNS